jgi:Spy/CpxP family protein refolding chaperone
MSSTNVVLERTSLGRSWDPKLASAVMLLLVFLCGAAAGAVVMNLGVHKGMHQPAFDTAAGKARYFERMRKDLDLTPAQSEQIESLLNDFWQLYHTVLSDSKQRVEQLLNEEQKKKFELFLQQQQPR